MVLGYVQTGLAVSWTNASLQAASQLDTIYFQVRYPLR